MFLVFMVFYIASLLTKKATYVHTLCLMGYTNVHLQPRKTPLISFETYSQRAVNTCCPANCTTFLKQGLHSFDLHLTLQKYRYIYVPTRSQVLYLAFLPLCTLTSVSLSNAR